MAKAEAKEEEWARCIVAKEMKRVVVRHDDNSKPSMYDLRVGPVDAPEIAIECIGAVDPVFTATWNVGPANGPLKVAIRGDWVISIASTANIKLIKQRIETLLSKLESLNINKINSAIASDYELEYLFEDFKSIGIYDVDRYDEQGTGNVHWSGVPISGGVDINGFSIPVWVNDFLTDPTRKDVLEKLLFSNAIKRHVFIIVSFAGAPWPVTSYLTRILDQLPNADPDLPSPITGVWLAPTYNKKGIYWDEGKWRLFDTEGNAITRL